MKVIVVGATGLIGRRLTDALLRGGHAVLAVSRGGDTVAGAPGLAWDAAAGPLPAGALDGADAVVNLAGAGIGDGRWTAARKRLIRDSRVLTTRGIVDALAADGAPRVLLNASAVGYYGTGEETRTEDSPPGRDFLAETCVAWEAEATRAAGHGVRVVLARTGIVLAKEGGAVRKQLGLYRAGLGGPLAGGRQWQSWIHADDVVGLMTFALERDDLSGPVNLTAPEPVRQARFAKAFGRAVGRPAWVWTPGFGLRLLLGEMATLALDGQRVLPERALGAGYTFRFTDVEAALRDALA
jgi:uncharacterized protein (TIGR01777 family)